MSGVEQPSGELALGGEVRSAPGVHAGVAAEEATIAEAALDPRGGEAHREELAAGDCSELTPDELIRPLRRDLTPPGGVNSGRSSHPGNVAVLP